MQRRGSSGQPAKGQSANRPKARNAPTAQVAPADLQEQVAALTRERDEALEQLAATSEVPQVISGTPGELQPVFGDARERNVFARLGWPLYLHDGNAFRAVAATHDAPPLTSNAQARPRDPTCRIRHLGALRAPSKSSTSPTSVSSSPTWSTIHLSSPRLNSADLELRLEFRC
jgi:hypothetical protein